MSASLAALQTSPLPPAAGLLAAALGSYVAFDLGQRVRRLQGAARNPWLMAAAFALCVGLWSAQVLGLSSILAGYDAGFDPGLAILAALLGLAGSALALRCWFVARPSWPAAIGGAALLATSVLAVQALLLGSVGLAPQIRWHPGWLAAGWAGAGLCLTVAAAMYFNEPRVKPATTALRLAGAALAAAAAMLLAQALVVKAAQLPRLAVQADDTLIATSSMAAAVATGSLELLLALLLASLVERRVRAAFERRAEPAPEPFRDPLTGLPTRATFEGTMAQALKLAETAQQQAALLLVALDGFKHVNDDFGHPAGDLVLQRMAQRLRELAPAHRVARLGGDEFLVLVDGPDAVGAAQALAARVLESISRPCILDGREIVITASIGVALYPRHGAAQALITHASIAARTAKAAGGATHATFDPRMIRDSRERAELLNDLRLALSQRQLELYYQPKVHAPSGQITGVEALLRWHHPKRGMVSPAVFIPLAENSGLIQSMGAWVIDEACRQARRWRDEGLRMRVAINLSAHQLRHADLPARVAAALQAHQVNPELLTCEITETVALEDTEATMKAITDLAAVGVHISIDDFGSGYSSLGYLRRLPANELKIDRSFVLDLENCPEAYKIAQAVVNLAQALNLKVVAEGVENDEQYRILRSLGCNELQGYLFAKPMSAKALALWAMDDVGPRSLQFRESLFQATAAMAQPTAAMADA